MFNAVKYKPSQVYYSNTIHTMAKYQNISQKLFIKMTCELVFKSSDYKQNNFHVDTQILSNFLYDEIKKVDKKIINFRNNDILQNYIYNIYQFKKYYPNIEYFQENSKIYVLYQQQKYSIREFDNLYLQNKFFFDFPIKILNKKININKHELVIIITVGNIETAIDILQNLLNNYQHILLAISINDELELNIQLLTLIEKFDNYIIYPIEPCP